MIETATGTDLKQQWVKLKASTVDMYAPVPLSNFCHFKKQDNLNRVIPQNIETKTNFINILTRSMYSV